MKKLSIFFIVILFIGKMSFPQENLENNEVFEKSAKLMMLK